MAQDNVLGIQATVNGKDIHQGADEFIRQVGRMEAAADSFISDLASKSRMVNGQVESIGVSFDSVVKTITKGAAALGVAFSAQQFVTQVAKTRGEFQQLEVAFTTMLGSAEKANALMSQLTTTAAVTPFGLQEIASGAKSLLAYGVASEKVNDTLVRLGDIASGLSIPLNDLVYLYGTTMTQGKMFTQDLRQFQGRGIPLADELAKQFGVTKDRVGELVTAGKVGFAELEKAIISMTSEGGKFGGLMEAQSKTIIGQWSNIQDAIDGMFNEVGKSQEGVINTALEGVSLLVENYEAVGRSILALVATYGTYKAALITTIVLHKSWAVAARVDATAKALLTAATKAQTVAQLALNAAMKANPYVLLASVVAGLGMAMWALADRTTAAEKANKSYNEALEKQNAEHKKHKEYIDSLVASMGDIEVSEGKRIENFQLLKQEYPKILENINSENEFLAKKHQILQLINEEQSKKNQTTDKQQLYIEEQKLARWENFRKQYGNTSRVDMDGNGWADTNVLDAINEQRKIVNKQKAKVAQPAVESYLKSVKEMKDTDLKTALEDVTNLLFALQGAGDEAIGIFSSIGGEISKGQLKIIKSTIDNEIGARNQPKKTAKEWLQKYKSEYDAAEKALSDFMKKKAGLTEAKFKEGLENLTAKRDLAKENYEKAGGSLKKDNKEIKEEEQVSKQVLNIKRKNEELKVKLQEEGKEKRLQQIKLEKEKELDEVEEQRKAWTKAQGELTTEQKKILEEREALIDKEAKKAELDIYKDEAESMRNFLKEYGTFQQQKLAITEEYAEKIKKAQTEGEKLILGKERDKILQKTEISMIQQTIDWGSIFGDFGVVFKEQLEPTIQNLQKITHTDTFKSQSSEDQKILFGIIKSLQQSATVWDGGIFVKVSEDFEKYRAAMKEYNEVMNSQAATAEEVATAQKNLSEATVNLQSSSLQAETMFSELARGISGLGSGTLEGIGKGLMQLDKLFNIGITEDVGNALVGGITKLFGADSSVTKTLKEALGSAGFIGELISAILSILDILKDGIGTLVANILDTILRTINNIIENILSGKFIEQIGTSLIIGIGNIIDTITRAVGNILSFGILDGGVSDWVTNSNAEEVNETINRLTDRNKLLTTAVENLTKEMEKSRGAKSVQSYAEAVKYQEEKQQNLLDMAKAQAGYHNAHHSWNYYFGDFTESEIKWIRENVKATFRGIGDLWTLTPEEMKKLQSNPTIWGRMQNAGEGNYGERVTEKLEDYANEADAIEELLSSLQEGLTSMTFDGMYDNFISELMDMDKSAKEIADNVSEYFMKAMLSNFVGEEMYDELKTWYEKFAEYMKDGLDKSEIDELRAEYEDLVNKGVEKRDALAEITGYSSNSTYSQETSKRGFETMSQDTATELNGRFTALQIAGEEIRKQSEQQTALQTLISADTAIIKQDIATQKQYISEIVDIQYESVGYLAEISKNTKQLYEMNERLGKIEENTRNI